MSRIPFPHCPLCADPTHSVVRDVSCEEHPLYRTRLCEPNIRWQRCATCDHVYTSGFWSAESLALILDSTPRGQEPYRLGRAIDMERLELDRLIAARLIDRVLSTIEIAGAIWLDVGCGAGGVALTASEYGFAVTAIDVRRESIDALGKLPFGIDARCVDLCDYATEVKYNIVTLLDVLEHVPDPVMALNHVRSLIHKRGSIVVSMPNFDSSVLRASGGDPYWSELEHYHNFTRTTLYGLLLQCGFTPVRYGVSDRYVGCMEVIAELT